MYREPTNKNSVIANSPFAKMRTPLILGPVGKSQFSTIAKRELTFEEKVSKIIECVMSSRPDVELPELDSNHVKIRYLPKMSFSERKFSVSSNSINSPENLENRLKLIISQTVLSESACLVELEVTHRRKEKNTLYETIWIFVMPKRKGIWHSKSSILESFGGTQNSKTKKDVSPEEFVRKMANLSNVDLFVSNIKKESAGSTQTLYTIKSFSVERDDQNASSSRASTSSSPKNPAQTPVDMSGEGDEQQRQQPIVTAEKKRTMVIRKTEEELGSDIETNQNKEDDEKLENDNDASGEMDESHAKVVEEERDQEEEEDVKSDIHESAATPAETKKRKKSHASKSTSERKTKRKRSLKTQEEQEDSS